MLSLPVTRSRVIASPVFFDVSLRPREISIVSESTRSILLFPSVSFSPAIPIYIYLFLTIVARKINRSFSRSCVWIKRFLLVTRYLKLSRANNRRSNGLVLRIMRLTTLDKKIYIRYNQKLYVIIFQSAKLLIDRQRAAGRESSRVYIKSNINYQITKRNRERKSLSRKFNLPSVYTHSLFV